MTKEPQVSELITMQQAAQYCGRSHSQVQSYARSGQLRAWKVGMQWLTTEKELDRYFKSRNSQREWLNHCQKMTKFAKIRAGHRCNHCLYQLYQRLTWRSKRCSVRDRRPRRRGSGRSHSAHTSHIHRPVPGD